MTRGASSSDRFDRQRRIEEWDQERLAAARVLVVGAGTTGNEGVKNLALVGIGACDVVDSDVIEEVNLSRRGMFTRDDVGKDRAAALAARAGDLAPDYPRLNALTVDIVEEFGSGRYGDYSAVIGA